jgi:hypothetical protein
MRYIRKYPVWIKLEKNGKVLKAVDFLDIYDCYECKCKGKRELVYTWEPKLFSRDRKTWLPEKDLEE